MEVMIVLVVLAVLFAVFLVSQGKKNAERRLSDSQAEARRWHERLGGQTMNLVAGSDNRAAQQALADAGERYTAAGSQLSGAASRRQFELAADTAIEGLHYVRAARLAMDLDAGPEVPQTSGQREAGSIREPVEAEVDGRQYRASPTVSADTNHYYPGGMVDGRPVPAGWYSEPWWKPALVAGAWGLGSVMIFNALVVPSFESGAVDGGDQAGDFGGGDHGGDYGGGDFGGGSDFGGGFNGGDFGGF